MTLLRFLTHGALILALFVPASAGDWYVDAAGGDDANDGQSPASAWRTLTHALASIPTLPAEEHTLHVAPGTYDPAHGEVFPLRPPPLVRILGTGGSTATVLAGSSGQPAGLLAYSIHTYDERSGATGLTLRDAVRGIGVHSGALSSTPAFHDLVIRGMSEVGIAVSDVGHDPGQASPPHPTFTRVEIFECALGVGVSALAGSLGSATASLTLTDCTIRDCLTDGMRVIAQGNAGSRATLERCRVVHNGGHGVYAEAFGQVTVATVSARASLFAENQGDGLFGRTTWAGEFGEFHLIDSTVASNQGFGVRGLNIFTARLWGSIVAGHAADVQFEQPIDARSSNAADGSLLGLPDCIAADPLFVYPGGGDFRLSWGSPSIDSGDPASSGNLDLLGALRPLDGNLDTVAAPDMGAFEFQPLHLEGTPRPGAILAAESWGPAGAAVRLLSTQHPLVSPLSTPFGELALERNLVRLHPLPAIPGSGPLHWSLRIPLDPTWIGTSLSLQTLTGSPAAPHGAALSNPSSFVIQP